MSDQQPLTIMTGIIFAFVLIIVVIILVVTIPLVFYPSSTTKSLPETAMTKLTGLPISVIHPTVVRITLPSAPTAVQSVSLCDKASDQVFSSFPTSFKDNLIYVTIPSSLSIKSTWDATVVYMD